MKSYNILFIVLIMAVCLSQFAADIYAPSLPAVAIHFNTSIHYVQRSMAVYMLGVAASQLVYGPLSEGFGRKPLLVIGLMIMLAGSIICLTAPHIGSLMIGRFIQGCGAGACASLWRAVFRDIFSGEALAQYGSYLAIFIMFIVPTAPLLGGYLQETFGWYASFVFMAFYALIALLGMLFGFKETSKNHHMSRLKIKFICKSYLTLLKSPVFMGVTCSTFLTYGAFFAWFVIGPALLIQKIGISPIAFGWLTFCGAGSAYALSGYLNGKLVKRFGMPCMMRFGWSLAATAGALMIIGYWIAGMNTLVIILPVILFYFGATFIWPNAFATAFTPFGHIAGYAGALYGFMQICGAVTLTTIISYIPDHNQLPFGLIMLICPISAWLIYEMSMKTRIPPKQTAT